MYELLAFVLTEPTALFRYVTDIMVITEVIVASGGLKKQSKSLLVQAGRGVSQAIWDIYPNVVWRQVERFLYE